MRLLVKLLVGLYTQLLHLYPRRYRNEYADELLTVFELTVRDAAEQGLLPLVAVAWREVWDLPAAVLRQHAEERRKQMAHQGHRDGMMGGAFAAWREILAVSVPLVLFGTIEYLLVAYGGIVSLQLLLVLAAVPASVIVLADALVIRQGNGTVARRRHIELLFAGVVVLLAGAVALMRVTHSGRYPYDFLAVLLLPTISGALVLVAGHWQDLRRHWTPRWLVFLATIVLLLAVMWRVGTGSMAPNLVVWILIFTAVLALLWGGARRLGDLTLLFVSLFILLWVPAVTTGPLVVSLPEMSRWLKIPVEVLSVFSMIGALILPAVLVNRSLSLSQIDRRRLILRVVLAVLLVGIVAYTVVWDAIWSAAHARAAEDHLPFMQTFIVIAGGVVLTGTLRGRRKLTGVAYMLLVIAALLGAFHLGWNTSAFAMTEARAAKLDRAIQTFHDAHGRYPTSLDELSPRYLLYVPGPVVLRHQSWCYQGADTYYRLGYVSGEFTYRNASFFVQTHAAAGQPPVQGWACDDLAIRYERGDLVY